MAKAPKPGFVKGPQGNVMKVTVNGKQELWDMATRKDINDMSTAQKINLGTRTKGNKKF